MSKIAENCDHNIDPRLGEYRSLGEFSPYFVWAVFLKISEVAHIFMPFLAR
jgi:hypothetical protein